MLGKQLILEIVVPGVSIFLYSIFCLYNLQVFFFFLCKEEASGFYRNLITKLLSM